MIKSTNDALFYDIETSSESYILEKHFNSRTTDTFHALKIEIVDHIKQGYAASKKNNRIGDSTLVPVTSMLFFTTMFTDTPHQTEKQTDSATVSPACGSSQSKQTETADSGSIDGGSNDSSGGSSDGGSSCSSSSSCGGGCGSS